MRPLLFWIALLVFMSQAHGQYVFRAVIVGDADNHQVSWTTRLNYNYQVEASPDLESWVDTGIAEPGTGSSITYGFSSTADKMFYRVKESVDPYNGGFLVLPSESQQVDLIDGVCFSFNLDALPALPAKIRIYQRNYQSTAPWKQIGGITDFATIDGIKFVRGSAVWLPDAQGDYEVQAVAVDASGTAIASAVRHVIVGANEAPTIVITGGPTTPSATAEYATFTTTVSDPDGDEIRRVDFFDNGILIGTDREAPFGDEIVDVEGRSYNLLRGTHSITAKAYDSRGAEGVTASAMVISITGGNARPTMQLISPQSGLIVTQGQTFTVSYTEGDPDGLGDLTEVSVSDLSTGTLDSDYTAPFGDFVIDTSGWTTGTHRLKIEARDTGGDWNYPLYFTVFIRTGAGQSFAERLVANIVDEATATPSNELFTGAQVSSDEFVDGFDSGLQIDSGVLLTTGLFSLWNGGDVSEGSGQDNGQQGDSDLENRVTGRATFDATVLEFDVFSSNGQLEMDYQLGSEEYKEYVGAYNDGFMATINGVLVTLVPDCSDIVAVNSIHPYINSNLPAVNEHLYLDDDLDIDPTVAPANQPVQVEYDGMTIRLKAHAFVTPNTTHRIKIVIGDVNDGIYDSGLFIGEDSIRSIKPQP